MIATTIINSINVKPRSARRMNFGVLMMIERLDISFQRRWFKRSILFFGLCQTL